jgi:hypothetical protein
MNRHAFRGTWHAWCLTISVIKACLVAGPGVADARGDWLATPNRSPDLDGRDAVTITRQRSSLALTLTHSPVGRIHRMFGVTVTGHGVRVLLDLADVGSSPLDELWTKVWTRTSIFDWRAPVRSQQQSL